MYSTLLQHRAVCAATARFLYNFTHQSHVVLVHIVGPLIAAAAYIPDINSFVNIQRIKRVGPMDELHGNIPGLMAETSTVAAAELSKADMASVLIVQLVGGGSPVSSEQA